MVKKIKIKLYEILMLLNTISTMIIAGIGLFIVATLGVDGRDMVNVFLGLVMMIAIFISYGILLSVILNRVYDLFD